MIDAHNHIGVELAAYLRGEFPYCQDLLTLVGEGKRLGVTKWVVFPMVSNLCMDLAALRNGEIRLTENLERIPYAYENRRLLEEVYDLFPEEARNVYPFVFIDPVREVAGQVSVLKELRKKYRFFGFKLQTEMIHVPLKGLLVEGSVFLDLARDWNLPVLLHTSVRRSDPWAQVADACEIVEKHPDIRFCLAHSCRFDRAGLECVASLPNAWFDCSAHRIHCELATQNSPLVPSPEKRFPSQYEAPEQVLKDLAEQYPEKLIWGSDSPYYSFIAPYENEFLSLKSSYAEEVACVESLPSDLMERVTEINTLRFLGVAS